MNMMSVDLVRLVREETGGHTDSADAPLHDRVVEALREVHDPEIPVNIYDLGLIYRLDVDEVGRVDIDMTLTTPNCPVAESMPNMVMEAVQGVDEVASVNVNLVWDPPWGPDKMSEEARMALDMFG
jgi:FeS assembly SUF system protein